MGNAQYDKESAGDERNGKGKEPAQEQQDEALRFSPEEEAVSCTLLSFDLSSRLHTAAVESWSASKHMIMCPTHGKWLLRLSRWGTFHDASEDPLTLTLPACHSWLQYLQGRRLTSARLSYWNPTRPRRTPTTCSHPKTSTTPSRGTTTPWPRVLATSATRAPSYKAISLLATSRSNSGRRPSRLPRMRSMSSFGWIPRQMPSRCPQDL